MSDRETTGVQGSTRRLARWEGRLWIALVVVVPVVGGVLSLVFWDHLHDGQESLSSTIRNLALVIGGVDAALLALWRSRVAERQAEAAHRQVATAERGLLNEQYQRGAGMLGSDVLSVRLGGISALQRLAEEHPRQFHVQVLQLFCAFVQHPVKDEGVEKEIDQEREPQLRQDVQAVMTAISTCHARQFELKKQVGFRMDLRGANQSGVNLEQQDLSGAELSGTNMSHASLWNANLSRAELINTDLTHAILWDANLSCAELNKANLSDAWLSDADLSDAWLSDANLSHADLDGANLSGTIFEVQVRDPSPAVKSTKTGILLLRNRIVSPASGLTQRQLDAARADAENPPKLEHVIDSETQQRLVWRGKSTNDKT